jgi:hypothetical protein
VACCFWRRQFFVQFFMFTARSSCLAQVKLVAFRQRVRRIAMVASVRRYAAAVPESLAVFWLLAQLPALCRLADGGLSDLVKKLTGTSHLADPESPRRCRGMKWPT